MLQEMGQIEEAASDGARMAFSVTAEGTAHLVAQEGGSRGALRAPRTARRRTRADRWRADPPRLAEPADGADVSLRPRRREAETLHAGGRDPRRGAPEKDRDSYEATRTTTMSSPVQRADRARQPLPPAALQALEPQPRRRIRRDEGHGDLSAQCTRRRLAGRCHPGTAGARRRARLPSRGECGRTTRGAQGSGLAPRRPIRLSRGAAGLSTGRTGSALRLRPVGGRATGRGRGWR